MAASCSESSEGGPCDKQQEENREDIFAWHTTETDFPTFMWGLVQEESENKNVVSLSAG